MDADALSKPAGGWERLLNPAAAEAGDAQFTLLVERRSRFVFRLAFAVVRNVEDAEDIVQETFLKLFRSGAWRSMQDERAFLARVAWRLAVARSPKKKRAPVDAVDQLSTEESPEAIALRTDSNRAVHRLIDALPEKLRQPLVMLATEELTAREIAAAMSVPEGTVRRRIMEARRILKEKMERLEGIGHE